MYCSSCKTFGHLKTICPKNDNTRNTGNTGNTLNLNNLTIQTGNTGNTGNNGNNTKSRVFPNKGTGAGGSNTNVNGKTFEYKTNNESRLLSNGFVRNIIPGCNNIYNYYLVKEIGETESITYLTQGGMKAYFKTKNIEMCRSPDEAYLFKNGDKNVLKILEKKNQNTPGSVDTKLLAGKGFIDEYSFILGENYTVKYAFCISEFLKKDYISDCIKSKALRFINQKYDIDVLFGDDDNYYEMLDEWIGKGME